MRSRSQRIQSHRLIERRRYAARSPLAGLVLAALVWFFGAPTGALAATFVVNQTGDPGGPLTPCVATPPGDPSCSLREAILAANNLISNPGLDMITFAPGVSSTLSRTGSGENASATGDLDITDHLIIQGNGATQTIIAANFPGGNPDRVFHVVSTVTVTFSGLTIRNGGSNTFAELGGGILSEVASVITFSDAVVENNAATNGGGIYVNAVGSQLTVTNSVLSGNISSNFGGGVFCGDCALTLVGSTISGNLANGSGGGVMVEFASAHLTMDRSELSLNTAQFGGGVEFLFTDSSHSITATNITGNVANNAGGGISWFGNTATATLAVNLNRISGNTAAVAAAGGGIRHNGLGTIDATNNWWGCDDFPNVDPGCDTFSGTVTVDPRVDLRFTADPPVIALNATSTLTADLTQNSDMTDYTMGEIASLDAAFNGVQVDFAPLTNVVPPVAPIADGIASTIFTGLVFGITTTHAFLDNVDLVADVNVVNRPTLTIDDVTLAEGTLPPGTTPFQFTVTRSHNQTPLSVNFATAPDMSMGAVPATPDVDYQHTTGTVVFAAGPAEPLTGTITVLVNREALVEANETFLVNLTSLSGNPDITDGQGKGTILNDDSAFLTISDPAPQFEGPASTPTAFIFNVTLNGDVDTSLTVDFTTADGSAEDQAGDGDYVGVGPPGLPNNQLSFTGVSGQMHPISITVNGDDKVELIENFFVDLSNIQASGRLVGFPGGDNRGEGSILNDDQALISIDDVTDVEGDSPGTMTYTFTVTLNAVVDVPVGVPFHTEDGSAATGDNDYSAFNDVLTFNPGDAEKTIQVTVNGDDKVEGDESFVVVLDTINATGRDVQFGQQSGSGNIQNDDVATLSISDPMVNEGASGDTNLEFRVTLSAEVDTGFTVAFATADGTAVDGNATVADIDYLPDSDALNFTGAAAGEELPINITVKGDEKVELSETFSVNLSNIQFPPLVGSRNVSFAKNQGVGMIVNDDQAFLSINDQSLSEGASGGNTNFPFTVTLSAEVDVMVTVTAQTQNVSATTGDSDYLFKNCLIQFSPGAPGQPCDVSVVGDNKVELDETFLVNLSNIQASGRSVSFGVPPDSQGVGTIVNDDQARITILDLTKPEGTNGTTDFAFSAILLDQVDTQVMVDYATMDGSATAGDNDFVPIVTQTITFNGNANDTQPVHVFVNADAKVEEGEDFTVRLSNIQASGRQAGAGVVFEDSVAQGNITNDDTASLSIDDPSMVEGAAGDSNVLTFTVTLDKALSSPVSLNFATADGTATAGSDYTAQSDVLTFTGITAGQQQQIEVPIIGDDIGEPDETVFVDLSNLQAGVLVGSVGFANQQGTGTIENDDMGTCGSPNDVVLENQVLAGMETIVACQTITLGPSLQITASANIIFRAGTSVIFLNGVSIESGAVVSVEIDPVLSQP